MIKDYYKLAKPGIIYGNAITAVAGFLLASKYEIRLGLLAGTIIGISLIIGSACVINNYIDRDIDKRMKRTKSRAIASGVISGRDALIFALVLGVVGFSLLSVYTNILTVGIGIIGYIDYVLVYAIYKRRSVYGTIVGSISGAVPIVAGYTAVTAQFNTAALLLFLILVLWQMPHFYAIALYRVDDYANAKLPVLPVIRGVKSTKVQIVLYIIAFIFATTLVTLSGYTGYLYLIIMSLFGLGWLLMAAQGFYRTDNRLWARQMFRFSLIIIMVFSILISFGTRLG